MKGDLAMPRQLKPEPTPTLMAPQEPTFPSEFYYGLAQPAKVTRELEPPLTVKELRAVGVLPALRPPFYALSTLRGGNLGPRGDNKPVIFLSLSQRVGEARAFYGGVA